jgi:peptidoglycan/LPS O-acetylase OafA/YrhL
MNPYSAVWWSLATEAQFYLLLPVLLLGRWRAGRVALAVLFAVWVVAYVTLVRGGINLGSIGAQMALHNSVFGRGPLFLCGIAAAAVYWLWGDRIRAHLAARRWFRNGGADVLLLGVLLALGALLQWVVAIGPARQQGIVDQHWHATTGVLWACVLLLVLLAPLRTKLLFSNAILGQLGILSYSIYMIHSPLIFLGVMAVRRTWPFTFDGITPYSMAMLAALILLAIGLSALSYRVIERPFLVRKARFDT